MIKGITGLVVFIALKLLDVSNAHIAVTLIVGDFLWFSISTLASESDQPKTGSQS